jgi:GT2 family glycosyltransferase
LIHRSNLPPTPGTVGVVLVNWNGAEHTIPCIASLLSGSVTPDRIVVVDNASRDDSAERIVSRFPEVTLLRNTENLGFTGANNQGIERLIASGCDYIWILNNDTIVDRECLSTLKEHLEAHRDVAACSGKVLYAEPRDLIWFAGATVGAWTLVATHRGVGERDTGRYDRIEPTPFLSGCCMFVRREALQRLGAFDDRFFAYFEDADWCLRAGEAGVRLDYQPRAVLWHKVSATLHGLKAPGSAGTTSPFGVYITIRNRWFLIRKHARSPLRMATAGLAHALATGYHAGGLLLLGRFQKLKAVALAVYDGLFEPLDESASRRKKPRYLG